MQLFFIVFAPGAFISWLIYRNKDSWIATILSIVCGAIVSYAVVYLMGNYVQASTIQEMEAVMGKAIATEIINNLYGRALLTAVGVIAVIAIAVKLRKKQSS